MQDKGVQYFRFRPGKNRGMITRGTFFFVAVIAIPLGLILLFVGIQRIRSTNDLDSIVIALFAVVFLFNLILVGSVVLVTMSDIAAAPDGITLYPLSFWPIFLPWSMLSSALFVEVKRGFAYGGKALQEGVKPLAVHVKGLPLLHRMAGLYYYGLGFTPVFVITADHARYRDLVALLEERIGSDATAATYMQPDPAIRRERSFRWGCLTMTLQGAAMLLGFYLGMQAARLFNLPISLDWAAFVGAGLALVAANWLINRLYAWHSRQ